MYPNEIRPCSIRLCFLILCFSTIFQVAALPGGPLANRALYGLYHKAYRSTQALPNEAMKIARVVLFERFVLFDR